MLQVELRARESIFVQLMSSRYLLRRQKSASVRLRMTFGASHQETIVKTGRHVSLVFLTRISFVVVLYDHGLMILLAILLVALVVAAER